MRVRGGKCVVVCAPHAAHAHCWISLACACERSLCRAWPLSTNAFPHLRRYAVTRYVQAVQSRGTPWPIKFNGMAFTAFTDDVDFRDWGPSNWWQVRALIDLICLFVICGSTICASA